MNYSELKIGQEFWFHNVSQKQPGCKKISQEHYSRPDTKFLKLIEGDPMVNVKIAR